jgi:methylmalonyl-CoA mutase N-terminal domain/subunit
MRDKTMRDKPWIFRTYAGHSTARDSNALYRGNLAKGQTGLSVAFDLPTQTGYDSDHVLARGEVGKVGVPISHLGDMRALFDGIPLASMNTSMTINATAAWLMALYIAVADEQGAPRSALTGTIQNDIIKEYLSRGTCRLSMGTRLIALPSGTSSMASVTTRTATGRADASSLSRSAPCPWPTNSTCRRVVHSVRMLHKSPHQDDSTATDGRLHLHRRLC